MELKVTSDVIATLVSEAARAAPFECCGILLGADAIERAAPAINRAADPARHFEIDPQALISAHRAARGGGPLVLGYYHSHPSGDPAPSATDRACAVGDGRVWAIVAEGRIAFWADTASGFAALSYAVVDG